MGRTLQNDLRVLEKLGSTHEGPLYRAESPTGLEVALLILGPEAGGHEASVDPATLAYLQQRFRRAAQIRHLNVAAVNEMGEMPEGPVYVVLESLAGEPLSEILDARGVLPLGEAVDLCLQAAAGLEAAHEVGLVHANLSPDAVLVTQTDDGRPLVKLVGFALVSSRPPDPEGPSDDEVIVEYASPERLAGHVPDERSDVFSLGAVLHHLLVGVPPGFASEESFVPEVMRAVLAKALAPAPAQRFQTISEFAGAVERAAAVATRPRRVVTRRATAAGVALVVAGLWLFWNLRGAGPGANGLAQEGGTRTPASGVPAEGTETGSTLLAGGGSEGRETPIAPRATLPPPTPSQPSLDAPHAGSSPSDSALSPAQDRTETESAAANNSAKVRQERLASLRAAAAAATAKLDEERRRARASAVTRALNGDRQIQATQPSSVPGGGAAGADSSVDTSAMSTPSPGPASPTLEERAQIYLRIGLDEASRRLGAPAHAIEGMSPLFMGLAQGRFPEGADTTVPVVRAVYLDPNGALILLDQQRIWPQQTPPATTRTRWFIGDIMLFLHGDARPEMLTNLAGRVR